MKRAMIFAHYDSDNMLDDSVFYQLQSWRPHINKAVFVTTAALDPRALERLDSVVDVKLVRPNLGYDFMSYKTGLEALAAHYEIADFDEVIICNDSNYGPFRDFGAWLEKGTALECPVWGATMAWKPRPHLQSYFIAMRRDFVASEAFRSFWEGVEVLDDKKEIIAKYEIGFSDHLHENNINFGAVIDLKRIQAYRLALSASRVYGVPWRNLLRPVKYAASLRKTNPTIAHADLLLALGHPFVKVELIRLPQGHRNLDGLKKHMRMMQPVLYDMARAHAARTGN